MQACWQGYLNREGFVPDRYRSQIKLAIPIKREFSLMFLIIDLTWLIKVFIIYSRVSYTLDTLLRTPVTALRVPAPAIARQRVAKSFYQSCWDATIFPCWLEPMRIVLHIGFGCGNEAYHVEPRPGLRGMLHCRIRLAYLPP
jgi:hypothetical protein